MSETARHTTGWEDAGSVLLSSCGNVDVSRHEVIVHADEYSYHGATDICPNCGAVLKLVWDVRIEVGG